MPHQAGGSTIDKLIDQGIALLEAGDLVGARELLSQVVLLDPRNEKAWLWRAGAVATDDERRLCLNRVLAINPHNTVAQRSLMRLQPLNPAPELAPAATPDASPPEATPRLRRLSVQGPRLAASTTDSVAPAPDAPAVAASPQPTAPVMPPKSYSREMLYWPESQRRKKSIWLALLVGIVIVAFGAYAVLRSFDLVGTLLLLGSL